MLFTSAIQESTKSFFELDDAWQMHMRRRMQLLCFLKVKANWAISMKEISFTNICDSFWC